MESNPETLPSTTPMNQQFTYAQQIPTTGISEAQNNANYIHQQNQPSATFYAAYNASSSQKFPSMADLQSTFQVNSQPAAAFPGEWSSLINFNWQTPVETSGTAPTISDAPSVLRNPPNEGFVQNFDMLERRQRTVEPEHHSEQIDPIPPDTDTRQDALQEESTIQRSTTETETQPELSTTDVAKRNRRKAQIDQQTQNPNKKSMHPESPPLLQCFGNKSH